MSEGLTVEIYLHHGAVFYTVLHICVGLRATPDTSIAVIRGMLYRVQPMPLERGSKNYYYHVRRRYQAFGFDIYRARGLFLTSA